MEWLLILNTNDFHVSTMTAGNAQGNKPSQDSSINGVFLFQVFVGRVQFCKVRYAAFLLRTPSAALHVIHQCLRPIVWHQLQE